MSLNPSETLDRPARCRRSGVGRLSVIAILCLAGIAAALWISRDRFRGGPAATGPTGVASPQTQPATRPVHAVPFEPARVTVRYDPQQVATLTSVSGAKVTIPAGAIREACDVSLAPVFHIPGRMNTSFAGEIYELKIGGHEHYAFDKPVEFSIPYAPELAKGDVTVATWDESAGKWEALASQVDAASKLVTTRTPHATFFAVAASPFLVKAGAVIVPTAVIFGMTATGRGISMSAWCAGSETYVTPDKDFKIHYYKSGDHAVPTDAQYPLAAGRTSGAHPLYVIDIGRHLSTCAREYFKRGVVVPEGQQLAFLLRLAASDAGSEPSGESPLGGPLYLSPNLATMARLSSLDPDAFMRATAAHEFFHVIEDEYYSWAEGFNHKWWMEATAQYMSDWLWDEVGEPTRMTENYYVTQVRLPLLSMDQVENPEHYAYAAFFRHLDRKYPRAGGGGGFQLVQAIHGKGATPTLSNIDRFAQETRGKGLGELFTEFAVDYYHDGMWDAARYPRIHKVRSLLQYASEQSAESPEGGQLDKFALVYATAAASGANSKRNDWASSTPNWGMPPLTARSLPMLVNALPTEEKAKLVVSFKWATSQADPDLAAMIVKEKLGRVAFPLGGGPAAFERVTQVSPDQQVLVEDVGSRFDYAQVLLVNQSLEKSVVPPAVERWLLRAPASCQAQRVGEPSTKKWRVSWARVDLEDHPRAFARYRVYRKKSGEPDEKAQVQSDVSGATLFEFTLPDETDYVFFVKVVDRHGNESHPSPPSGGTGKTPELIAHRELLAGPASSFWVRVDTKGLDSGPGHNLLFTIYRSKGADGPFEKIDQPGPFASGSGTMDEKQAWGRNGRMGPNLFQVSYSAKTQKDSEADLNGPYHYRVGVRTSTGEPPVLGPELLSEPMPPGKVFLNHMSADATGTYAGQRTSSVGGWQTFRVAMSLDNQPFDFPGAHMTVTSGNWKGHFWSPRQTDKMICSWDSYVSASGNPGAGTRIPFTPQPCTAQITAESGTYSVTGTLNFPAEPEEQGKANVRANRFITELQKQQAAAQEAIRDRQNTLQRKRESGDQAAVAEAAAVLDYSMASWNARLGEIQISIARESYALPQLLELCRGQVEVANQFLATGLKTLPPNDTSQREYIERQHRIYLGDAYNWLSEAALFSGDAALFEHAMTGAIGVRENRPDPDWATIGKEYKRLADGIAMLTADRNRAASFFAKGREILLTRGSESTRTDEEKQLNEKGRVRYPAWWPADGSEVRPATLKPAGEMPAPKPADPATPPDVTDPARAKPPIGGPNPPTDNPRPPADNPRPPTDNPRAPTDNPRPPVTDRPRIPEVPPVVIPQPPVDPLGTAAAAVSQGEDLFRAGKYKEAAEKVNAAVAADPKNVRARLVRGGARLWSNDLAGARADFDAIAIANPDDVESRRLRATIDLVSGKLDVAAPEADALVRLKPNDPNVLILHAQVALWAGDQQAAPTRFAAVNAAYPNAAKELYDQAGRFLDQGVAAVSAAQFTTVLWLQPNNVGANYGLGMSYSKLGEKDRAIAALSTYLQADQTSEFAQRAQAEIRRLQP